ncbi:ribonuclease BN (tRNA processing enzyme) [Planomicrobium stackebrandtii]|uniref:Ribonuclease BN (tRNA processing enzyme) n=1 Tax=Planomicrobium stackebrandtii TaxID=253160 RepID=A0ABU0GWN1_9BACL|nr:MBL fold metallo-hydrolase [Planomicrobium stackebrandtii]MDQ0429784.1 ribonuclease BN (tRNA processing enzyme) [Planomicrobium stackebrandtii]
MKIIPIGIWGGYPNKNEATSAFLIEQDGFRCLVDCGSGVLAAVQNYTALRELDAVVISHYHPDHIADIGVLQHAAMVGMQLKEWDTPLFIHAHDKDAAEFEKLSYKGVTEGRAIQASETLELGPWQVTFCETVHPVYCLAMKFTANGRAAVFTADTSWKEELVEFSRGADLLVAESNLYEKYIGIIQGHLSGSQAGELAERAGAKQLLLTHLPQYGELDEILQAAKSSYSGEVEFAVIGKSYEI